MTSNRFGYGEQYFYKDNIFGDCQLKLNNDSPAA